MLWEPSTFHILLFGLQDMTKTKIHNKWSQNQIKIFKESQTCALNSKLQVCQSALNLCISPYVYKMELTGVIHSRNRTNSEGGSSKKVNTVRTRGMLLCKHSANITINDDKACWLYFALGSTSCCTYQSELSKTYQTTTTTPLTPNSNIIPLLNP